MDYTNMTDSEIDNELMEIVDEWDKTNQVFSITDLMELVTEQVRREYE
tara:strand:- start:19 stop:162 length:144 start_codon:yes stop_codon:yes gene_type:complete